MDRPKGKWEKIRKYIYQHDMDIDYGCDTDLSSLLKSAKATNERSEKAFWDFIGFFGFDSFFHRPQINYMHRFLNGNTGYNTPRHYDWDSPPYHPYMDNPTDDVDEIAAAFKRKGTNRIVYAYHPFKWDGGKTVELDGWCRERNVAYVVCPPEYDFFIVGRHHMVLLMSHGTYDNYALSEGFPNRVKGGV